MELKMIERNVFKKDDAERIFKVKICSGKGLGSIFVDSLKPNDPIIQMLGTKPYPGTLFVKLKRPINLKGSLYSSNTRPEVRILLGNIEGRVVVIKWTKLFPKNLQLMSNCHLRSDLELIDGQYSEIRFASGDLLPNSPEVYWLSFLHWAKTTRLANLMRTARKK
jgi:CTP-dependent riboflavin kinase